MEVEKSCQEDDVADDKDATKVFDSLAALQACLLKNEHRNMILFPTRDQREMSNSGVESLARSLEANTSLVSLTLEEVHLSSIHGIQPLVYALFNHRNLKRLTLYDNRLGNDGVAFLINAIQSGSYASLPRGVVTARHDSLRSLCLCKNQIGDRGAYWISRGLASNLKHIKELDLSSNHISDQGTILLAEMVAHSNLSTFILNGNAAGEKGAEALAKALQSNQQLDILGLCGNDIRDEGAIQISNVAKTHRSLTALLLEDNYIRERGLVAIADAYRNNPRLGMMEISWNFFSAKAMQILSASIESVVYLYLDNCEIGDAETKFLAKGLRFNRSVRDLFLEGNQIGMLGTTYLAQVLAKNDTLEGVFLDSNPITRNGALILRDVLKTSNMRLKRLQIPDEYQEVQQEMEVYLDMNGAGRKMVLQGTFPTSLWSQLLVQKDGIFDTDMIYLFLRERPDLFQHPNYTCDHSASR